MELVIATKNSKKLLELQELLCDLDINIQTLKDYPEIPEIIEDGNSFKANSLKKAKTVYRHTKKLTLADDSGLEVDFINRRPGILSSRFAHYYANDDENNEKLLTMLDGVPMNLRGASFKCVIAIVDGNGNSYFAKGSCEGFINDKPLGNNGFGYDPLFYLPAYGETFAELKPIIKNKISHRGCALKEAKEILKKIINEKYGKKI